MLNTDTRGLLMDSLTHLNKEHSPSVPYNFPKELLPSKNMKYVLFKQRNYVSLSLQKWLYVYQSINKINVDMKIKHIICVKGKEMQ